MSTRRMLASMVLMLAMSGVPPLAAGDDGHRESATLYTPPISFPSVEPQKGAECRVANIDNVDREIALALIAADGTIISSFSSVSIPPLNIRGITISLSESTQLFCRITVNGPRQSVRGGLCIVDFFTGGCTSSPVPAE